MASPALALDTVRDVQPSDSARDLMERAMRGEKVDESRLVSELARMLELVARTNEDFERLVLLVREPALAGLRSPAMRGRVLDVVALPDGSALVQTTFAMSSASFFGAQLGALFRDPEVRAAGAADSAEGAANALGGVPCFPASQLEVAAAAGSFEDALYLLGDAVAIV